MNHYERVIALLSEVNPAVAAAVRAVGCNRAGQTSIGLLGWLPDTDRIDLARACILAIEPPYHYDAPSPEALALDIVEGVWRRPQKPERQTAIDGAVWDWYTERHGVDDAFARSSAIRAVNDRQEYVCWASDDTRWTG